MITLTRKYYGRQMMIYAHDNEYGTFVIKIEPSTTGSKFCISPPKGLLEPRSLERFKYHHGRYRWYTDMQDNESMGEVAEELINLYKLSQNGCNKFVTLL